MANELLLGFEPPYRRDRKVPVWRPEKVLLANWTNEGVPDSGKSNFEMSLALQWHAMGYPTCDVSGKDTCLNLNLAREVLRPALLQTFNVDPRKEGCCYPLLEDAFGIFEGNFLEMANHLARLLIGVGADQSWGPIYFMDVCRDVLFLTLKRAWPILHFKKLAEESRGTLALRENQWLLRDGQHIPVALELLAEGAPHLNRCRNRPALDHRRHLQTEGAYLVANLDMANRPEMSRVCGKAVFAGQMAHQSKLSGRGIARQAILRLDDASSLVSSGAYSEHVSQIREKRMSVGLIAQNWSEQTKSTKGGSRNFGDEVKSLVGARVLFSATPAQIKEIQELGYEKEVPELSHTTSTQHRGFFAGGWSEGTTVRARRDWALERNTILDLMGRQFHAIALLPGEPPLPLRIALPLDPETHRRFRETPWGDAEAPAAPLDAPAAGGGPEGPPATPPDAGRLDDIAARRVAEKQRRKARKGDGKRGN